MDWTDVFWNKNIGYTHIDGYSYTIEQFHFIIYIYIYNICNDLCNFNSIKTFVD